MAASLRAPLLVRGSRSSPVSLLAPAALRRVWRVPPARQLHVTVQNCRVADVSSGSSGTEEKQRLEPTPEELNTQDSFLRDEIRRYYAGRRRLAEMMGREAETFTDQDVKDALRYLLPTSLSAKDARPFLKHPLDVYGKKKEFARDEADRPLEPAYFTGCPAYHNLLYEIFSEHKALDRLEEEGGGVGVTVGGGEGMEGDAGTDAKVEASEGVRAVGEAEGVSVDEQPSSPGAEEVEGGGGEEVEGEGGEEVEGEGGSGKRWLWLKREALATMLDEEISEKQYDSVVAHLTSLAAHPLSHRAEDFLQRFHRPVFSYRLHAKTPSLNESGEAMATGRRKCSTAEVRVRSGEGRMSVNGRSLVDYFPRPEDRQQVLSPLLVAAMLGGVDVTARVKGGGHTGQAGAVRLGLSKALLAFPGRHGEKLEEAGLLVRDPRAVERKKPGQKKARKKFAWVKR